MSDEDFCKEKSNVCVRFCPNENKNDWKPKVLLDALEHGMGRALQEYPNCSNSEMEKIDSRKTEFDIDFLENGFLDWGKSTYLYKQLA